MYKTVQLNIVKVAIDVLGEQYRYESVDVLCNDSQFQALRHHFMRFV